MWYASPYAAVRPNQSNLIYGRTGNCGSAASTGHKKIENTAPYLGIEVDEGLAIAKQVASELQDKADWLGPSLIVAGVPIGAVSNRSSQTIYSITSSARASKVGGTSRPSALAALKLMASPCFEGTCTGKSAGFSPLTAIDIRS